MACGAAFRRQADAGRYRPWISFPLRYFEVHHLAPDWPTFLEDFQRHWPTDEDNLYVDFVRDGLHGKGADRASSTRWRRLTEERAGSAKSVFHIDVPGSVATWMRQADRDGQLARFLKPGLTASQR